MNLNELRDKVHETARQKSWWDESPRTFGELIALCHSELSEALEEFRKGYHPSEVYYPNVDVYPEPPATSDKPEGIPIELADVIIRVLDMCGHYRIDIESAVELKMNYNRSRANRHGGKLI